MKSIGDITGSRIIAQGSRNFPYVNADAIVAGATVWIDIHNHFGNEARQFDYFDTAVITNNSAQAVHFYLNSPAEDYYILPYQSQPITRRAFRRFGFYNATLIDIAIGEISASMRRLPPDIMSVIQQQ